MGSVELDIIKQRIKKLPAKEKIELIKFLADGLKDSKSEKEPEYLVYGKYRNSGGHMSTEEDFKIAEWHPTDAELDGD